MAKGIRRLEKGDPLPWETDSRVVRLLIVDTKLDEKSGEQLFDKQRSPIEEVFFVYNTARPGDKRRPGYGLAGGAAKTREGSISALEREITEEVPYPIIGEPYYLLSDFRHIGERIERVDIYLAKVNRTQPQELRQGGEVTDGRWFDKREIWSQPVVNTRLDYSESEQQNDEPRGFFRLHLRLTAIGLRRRGELIQMGVMKP